MSEHKVKEFSALYEKWNAPQWGLDLENIKQKNKLQATVRLLENQAQQLDEDINVTSQIKNYDPVVLNMVRRITPQLIAHDIVGVQPMNMPTGLGFAIKAKYPDGSSPIDYTKGKEALYDTVDTAHSGEGTHASLNPFEDVDVLASTGRGMETATGERADWKSMGIEIDRVELVARTRQLRADWSIEVEQDLRAVHGLEASTELANILTGEIILEQNQELIRTLYHCATIGAKGTTTPGTFDYATESDGRWAGERALALWAFIEKEANRLALLNRRGRGNFIITSSNVATTLALGGVLKNDHNLTSNMDIDVIGSSYAGTIGRFKILIDPLLEHDGVLVGFKGMSEMDAGVIFAPYVPLAAFEGRDVKNGFKPAIGFHTRYGLAANPFVSLEKGKNTYYSKFKIDNLR